MIEREIKEKAFTFQFTPLREGRQRGRGDYRLCPEFQFTPLREGRHYFPVDLTRSKIVSIHAPA